MWVSSHLTGMCLYDFICITHTHTILWLLKLNFKWLLNFFFFSKFVAQKVKGILTILNQKEVAKQDFSANRVYGLVCETLRKLQVCKQENSKMLYIQTLGMGHWYFNFFSEISLHKMSLCRQLSEYTLILGAGWPACTTPSFVQSWGTNPGSPASKKRSIYWLHPHTCSSAFPG